MGIFRQFLIIFLFLAFSSKAMAGFISFGFGGITTHYTEIDSDKRYCNELKDSAVIYNQAYHVRIGGHKWSILGFVGQDSICSPIVGGAITRTLWAGESWRTGLVFGAYKFDIEHWERWATQTQRANIEGDTVAPEPVDFQIGDTHFVPIAAFEISFKLFGGKTGQIWLNNIISVFITNHSINYVINF